jgi:hypothetical protein
MSDVRNSAYGFPRIAPCRGGQRGGAVGQPRRPWRRRLGTALAVTVLAMAAAGCSGAHSAGSASASKSSSAGEVAAAKGPWKLVVPVQAGGLPLDEGAVQSGAYDQFMPSISAVNKDLKSEGRARSDVFGIYDLKPAAPGHVAPVVIFSGYDGTFNPQAVIRTESQGTGAKVTPVAVGPHGGSAVCVSSGTGANAGGACIWATDTTYAALFESGTGSQAVNSMPGLMVKMRADLEVVPGAAPAVGSGQVLLRFSGSANGNSASFTASTDKLKVAYTFHCGAASLNYGNFIASLTPDQGGADAYSPEIANLVGEGKTGTTVVDAPIGGVRYHISVIAEVGCNWSMVVTTD